MTMDVSPFAEAILPVGVTFAATLVSLALYRKLAIRRGIVAHMNERTLHETVVPRGGGFAFGSVFALMVIIAWSLDIISTMLMLSLGVGGAAAVTLGIVDDVYGVAALKKLFLHVGLALLLFAIYYQPLYAPVLQQYGIVTQIFASLALVFLPVWFINLYNFIDGIDGMAIVGAVFVCVTSISVLLLTGGDRMLVLLFALLGASSLGFLFWNIPPASIFMGDAGSIFLGYSFAALSLGTIFSRQISVWTWIAMMSYFLADTSTTTLCRIVLVKRWYGVHRSHAYQNLARIHKSHAKVTYGVALYHLLWALPMSLWSSLEPRYAPAAAVLALAPGVAWTLRFGPLFSRD